MRIMLSLSEEMHDALENERNQMMLKNIQNVIRLIISRHFDSEKQSTSETNGDGISPPEDRRSCGEVQIQDELAVFHPFIMIAHARAGIITMFEVK